MGTRFKKTMVVGLGLIGASFAGAYHKAYPEAQVIGVDVSQETLDSAIGRGWIARGVLPSDDLESLFSSCDLIMIATPVPVAQEYFKRIAANGFEGVVSDVCSTKRIVSQLAADALPHPEKYIPGHPMAGSEKSGIEGARADLFEGAHWVLCPDENTFAQDYADLHEMLTGIGARVVSLPREIHDDAMAIVSHVPHFTASALMELAVRHADNQETLFRLAAGGFKDSTRIAAGSPALWCGIAFDNREAIIDGLDEVRAILGAYADALRAEDKTAFAALLTRAAQARRAIPVRWLPASEDLLRVRVPLRNHPGTVAEVTTIASKVGCNIQSIEIDHVTSSSAVLDMVLTDEGDVGKLSIQLINAGYSVSLEPLSAKEN